MYKICVIGDRESVLGFSALGLDICEVSSTLETSRRLTDRKWMEQYAVVYITEDAARDNFDLIDYYKDRETPAIILIPGKNGPLGYGVNNVKKSVERAVGADILFRD
ncbi:V-type ATP synthase subunit F [Feifania hominis]|uniref:V-type ATP synthase subunit F n=1 Tax=Feifania hominis TaxID=2763660 RepID=A0A926HUL1_9FIRM|nr:V-type ATP synthase subunit F [Feifania hominis]MBC8536060.1 V-type ATP synthase subunit F [Feifania hominis]